MEGSAPRPGEVVWQDLTVDDAERIRDFYAAVVGWRPEGVDQGGYDDYNMRVPGTGERAAGVCFARGVNEGVPPQWLIYVIVEDLEASKARAVELGGTIVQAREKTCVIRDPAGAHLALYKP